MPIRVLRYSTLESAPLLLDDRNAGKDLEKNRKKHKPPEGKIPKKICICGKCSCRKHHCPVHHKDPGVVGRGPCGPAEGPSVSNVTDYRETFQSNPKQPARRGMKVPLVISQFDVGNRRDSEMETEHVSSFKAFDNHTKVKCFKPTQKYIESDLPLATDTSYKAEFKQPETRPLPRPQYGRHLQSLVRFGDGGVDDYNTTSEDHYKAWVTQPHCRRGGEKGDVCLFKGPLACSTTTQNSFSNRAIAGARPSTNYRKAEVTHSTNAPFVGDTTTMANFPHVENYPHRRGDLALRKKSKCSKETMSWPVFTLGGITQYSDDTTGVRIGGPRHRTGLVLPVADSLNIYRGNPGFVPNDVKKSLNNSTYVKSWVSQPKPTTPCKIKHTTHTSTVPFDGTSSTKVHFPPIEATVQEQIASEVDKTAGLISYNQQNGLAVKLANRFAGPFYSNTTANDHFKPWETKPRVRMGEKWDATFQPCRNPFNNRSLYATTFVDLKGKPSDTCKPLDQRFKKEVGGREPFAGTTSYGQEFRKLELPKESTCPAHALLYD